MKIAWFTPFSQNSAIGKYSQIITHELRKHCEVDLWVSGKESLLTTILKVINYTPNGKELLKLTDYDLVIYNMGDYLDYHRDIYEVSRIFKGAVILHDFVMHHFFTGYYLLYKKDRDAYLNTMCKYYGVTGRKMADDSFKGTCPPLWESEKIVDYPLFEKVVDGATGIIVHSDFHAAAVRKRFLGPVRKIYHPFHRGLISPCGTTKADLGFPEDKLLVVTIGNINPNKMIDMVIEILGEDRDLAAKIIYVIIGSAVHEQYYDRLQSMVKEKSLHPSVKFLGFQTDDILSGYLLNADIFINLRFPAMEGASWSLVEELHYGQPVIVIDNGFYSEIPDECLVKIKLNNEKIGLHDTLTKLAADREMRALIGEKGKQFALTTFTAEKYCHDFMEFLPQVKSYQPILQLTDRVGQELAAMGATENMEAVNKAAQEMYNLFSNK